MLLRFQRLAEASKSFVIKQIYSATVAI